MPPSRPASDHTIYIIHAYGSVTNLMSMLACQYSQPKRPGDLDVWPFDLESGVPVTCDMSYLCTNFVLPRHLCSRLRPDVRDRQTDRQHHRLMPPPRERRRDNRSTCCKDVLLCSKCPWGMLIPCLCMKTNIYNLCSKSLPAASHEQGQWPAGHWMRRTPCVCSLSMLTQTQVNLVSQ